MARESTGGQQVESANSTLHPEALVAELGKVATVHAERIEAAEAEARQAAEELADRLQLGGRFADREFAVGSVLELYSILPEISWKLEKRHPGEALSIKYQINEHKFSRRDQSHSHFIGALYIAAHATGRRFTGFIPGFPRDGEYFDVSTDSDIEQLEKELKERLARKAERKRDLISLTFGD